MKPWSLVEAIAQMTQAGRGPSPRKGSGRGFRGASPRLGLLSIQTPRPLSGGRGRDRSAAAKKAWITRKRG